jgi:hypothetical protein
MFSTVILKRFGLALVCLIGVVLLAVDDTEGQGVFILVLLLWLVIRLALESTRGDGE